MSIELQEKKLGAIEFVEPLKKKLRGTGYKVRFFVNLLGNIVYVISTKKENLKICDKEKDVLCFVDELLQNTK